MKKFYKYILCFALLVCFVCFNFRSVKASATVTLTEGVSIRTNGDNGLMFEASVSSVVNNAEYGMVFIRGINNNFDVNSDGAYSASVTEVDEYNKYRVTMIKFPDSAFGTNISVKAFIKVGDNYTYSSNTVTCNLYEKAVTYKNSEAYNNEELIDYIVDNTYLSFVAYTGSNTTLHSTMVNDFMNDFNAFAGLNITADSFFASTYGKLDASSAKYVEFFTTSTYASKWNWMFKYINEVRVDNDRESLSSSIGHAYFRGEIHNLLNAVSDNNCDYGCDYSNRNDYRYYVSGKAPYTLPKLSVSDYIYDGWYYDKSFTGNKVTVATSNSPVYCNFVEPSDDYVDVNLDLNGGYITSSDVCATPYKTTLITKYGAGYSSTAAVQYISPIVNGKIDGGNSGRYQDRLGLQYDIKYDAYKIVAIYPYDTTADYSNVTHVLGKTALVSDSSLIGKYIITSEKLVNEGDVNITLSIHNESDFTSYSNKMLGETKLPTPFKENSTFIGWYDNPSFSGSKIDAYPGYVLNGNSITYYAKWLSSASDLEEALDVALGSISEKPNSNTIDELTLECNGYTIAYKSNNPAYVINNNGTATVSRVNQTHKKINAIVTITLNNGIDEIVKEKEIVIDPVLFDDLPDTPVATYFATSAAYSYKTYSERYKTEKTLFSNDAKDVLDIVYYAFATINADGTCQLADSSYVNEVNELKANDTRIIVSLNGAVSDGQINFYNITRDETLLATLIDNVCDMVEKYNFDGVDIDWEYNSNYPTENVYYTKLVTGLYNELASRQDDGGTPYMLTAAIPGTSWGTDSTRYDYAILDTYLDYINVMSYDLNKTEYTTHLSPLYTPSSANSYSFSLDYAVSRFESLGFPAEKLILGCAGYGKLYKITGTINSSATYVGLGLSGTLTQYANTVGSYASGTLFGNAIITLKNTGNFKEYHNYNNSGKFVGSYLYSESESLFVTYDSLFALEEKYKYAANLEGTGLMCWSYTENTDDSFITAISNQK